VHRVGEYNPILDRVDRSVGLTVGRNGDQMAEAETIPVPLVCQGKDMGGLQANPPAKESGHTS